MKEFKLDDLPCKSNDFNISPLVKRYSAPTFGCLSVHSIRRFQITRKKKIIITERIILIVDTTRWNSVRLTKNVRHIDFRLEFH